MQRLVVALVESSTRFLAARTRLRSKAAAATLAQQRWMRVLGFEFFAGAVFLAALFASGIGWLALGVLICWPLAASVSVMYLGISSDINAAEALTPETRPRRRAVQSLNLAIQTRLEQRARSSRVAMATAARIEVGS